MVVADLREQALQVFPRCGIEHELLRAGAGECYAPAWAVRLLRILQSHMGHLGLRILETANQDEEFRGAVMTVAALADASSPGRPSDGWVTTKVVEYAEPLVL